MDTILPLVSTIFLTLSIGTLVFFGIVKVTARRTRSAAARNAGAAPRPHVPVPPAPAPHTPALWQQVGTPTPPRPPTYGAPHGHWPLAPQHRTSPRADSRPGPHAPPPYGSQPYAAPPPRYPAPPQAPGPQGSAPPPRPMPPPFQPPPRRG